MKFYAILNRETHTVAIITIAGELTMPALFVDREQAYETLYKNDMNKDWYVDRVNPIVYKVDDENS